MKKILLCLGILILLYNAVWSQGSWSAIAAFTDQRAGSIAVSIGGKAYVGLGVSDAGYLNDLWEYDPVLNSWSPKASMPAPGRQAGIAFTINGKLYAGLGISAPYIVHNDIYEFDPAGNTWSPKASFAGGPKYGAMAFSIGSKGYVVGGKDPGFVNGTNDVWEFDPIANTWTQVSSAGPVSRSFGIAFSLNGKGYIGLGFENYDTRKKDIWEFDPDFNSWTQKRDFPVERYGALCFTIGHRAYAGAGYNYSTFSDFYEYNATQDLWTVVSNITGSGGGQGVAFSIGEKGYAGLGYDASGYLSNFYEFNFIRDPVVAFDPISVTTIAGSGSTEEGGFQDGPGANSRFRTPVDVAMDTIGNLYVADFGNNRIRKITPDHIVSTYAGSGIAGYANGDALTAQFNGPHGLTIDASGNIFVAEENGNRVRKISASGQVTTIAGDGNAGYLDGIALSAQFNRPTDVAVDEEGNLYVADNGNQRIRKIDNGIVSTWAGNGELSEVDGTGTNASFASPQNLAFDNYGSLYVTSIYGSLRKISQTAVVSRLRLPDAFDLFQTGIATDKYGNTFISVNHGPNTDAIVKISPNGYVSVLAGEQAGYKDSIGVYAQFYYALGLTVDNDGNMYAGDGNQRIRKLEKPSLFFTGTVGIPSPAKYFSISGINLKEDALLTAPVGFDLSLTPGGPFSTSLSVSPVWGEINVIPVYIRLNANSAEHVGGSILLSCNGAATQYLEVNGYVHTPALVFDPVVVTTYAGTGDAAFANGKTNEARFNNPTGVAVDSTGNVFVADRLNHRIRKISPSGDVTTLAGNGIPGFADGSAMDAQFNLPRSIALDAYGNVYVADELNHRIRKITPNGYVSTLAGNGVDGFADGQAATAQFNRPSGVTVDLYGNVFVADADNNRIRKITPAGIVTTIAGNDNAYSMDGIGTYASFNMPIGITIDKQGNLYVTQTYGPLRKITPSGVVSTILPPGMNNIQSDGVAIDDADNIYVSLTIDGDNNHIYRITPNGTGVIFLGGVTGYKDSTGTNAQFYFPAGLAIDRTGSLFVADAYNNRIRKAIAPVLDFSVNQGTVSSPKFLNISGTRLEDNAVLTAPPGYELSQTENGSYSASISFVPDLGEVNSSTAYIRMASNTPGAHNGNIALSSIGVITTYHPVTGKVVVPTLQFDRIAVSTFAGNGDAGNTNGVSELAKFNFPTDVTADVSGNIYVADYNNHLIRKITPSGIVSTFAGSGVAGYADGNALTAQFNHPYGITVDASGNVYVADKYNFRIRKINPAGVVTTLAGSGIEGFVDGPAAAAQFAYPEDVALDGGGNVYVADYNNNSIRKITPAGIVSTFAGNGSAGIDDGQGQLATFYLPESLAFDPLGNLLVTEIYGPLRKITSSGMVSTIYTPEFIYGFRSGIVTDSAANTYISVAESSVHNYVYKVTPMNVGALVAGDETGYKDSIGRYAQFNMVAGLAIDKSGNLYVADNNNNRIRKISTPLLNFSTATGTPSAEKYFRVSGVNLTNNAIVNVPSAFEISLTSGSGYASSLLLSPVVGEVTSVPVYIRLKGTLGAGTYNGNISLSSDGAITQSLAVSGVVSIDRIPPQVQCPPAQVFCFAASNTYTVPLLSATDNVGIRSITYTISGATNRSGAGPNASGIFNPGTSTIRWRVTDYSGNVSTCSTIIRIDNKLTVTIGDTRPLLIWGKENTIYKGFGPTCALLIAAPSGGTPYPGLSGYRYSWSSGATTVYASVCPPDPGSYTYTVTVTDALGCTATASKTIKVVDVRCGPNNNEITLCWFGTSQSCYSTWQAIIALYYGAQIGPCDQYTTQIQAPANKKDVAITAETGMKVFPNPNKGSFTLQVTNLEVTEIRIIDQNGKLVKRQGVNNVSQIQTINMNLGFVANGIYLVQALGKNGVYTAKVVVE